VELPKKQGFRRNAAWVPKAYRFIHRIIRAQNDQVS
jgi:hypothetical protein